MISRDLARVLQEVSGLYPVVTVTGPRQAGKSTLCPAWHRNLRKQAVKSPNIHFTDTGLVCHLLGISAADQLRHHPARGAIFETWVASEVLKSRLHAGREPSIFHLRHARGVEVDLVVEGSRALSLIEAKSGATVASELFEPLAGVAGAIEGTGEPRFVHRFLAYGGDRAARRHGAQVLPWSELPSIDWDG